MPVKIAQTSPVSKHTAISSSELTSTSPALPAFAWEVGWKYVYNSETGAYDQVPLTLLDILYPTEDEEVFMSESPLHDLWRTWLKVILQNYLAVRNWLIISDVYIHWGRRGVPVQAPDVAAIPNGNFPAEGEKSYRVGRDGPLPAFVLEMTSESTRPVDLQKKPLHYAGVGVKEMLIIDFLPADNGPWRLLGYRLEDNPYYRQLAPDAEGGLTFATIGLRFVAVGRERIEVYEVETGQRLLTPLELKDYADGQAAARAEAETRAETEAARAAQLEARLQELQTRYRMQDAQEPDKE